MNAASFLPDLLATPILALVLLMICRHDLRERRIPDSLSLPLIAIGIGLAALRTGGLPLAEIIGAGLGYGVFALLGATFYRLRGVDGLGLGDAKLLGAAGAWLGWPALPMLVLMASLGALGMVMLTARGRDHGLAFGPWLSAAFMALWLVSRVVPTSGLAGGAL